MKEDFSKDIERSINKITESKRKEAKTTQKLEKNVESLNKDRVTSRDLLKQLVVGQTRMIQTLNGISAATRGTSRSTRNLNKQNLLWVKNER